MIKIIGTACIPSGLSIDSQYKILTLVDCKSIDYKSNENGTCDVIYKLKLTGETDIINNEGKVIKAKDNRSMSQKLRGRIYAFMKEQGVDTDDQEFYEEEIQKIILYYDLVHEFLRNKS